MRTKRSPLRLLAAVCILAIGLSVIVLMTSQSTVAERDYITYWASGRLLLHHDNPYGAAALLALDRSAGSTGNRVAIIRYPPSGLLFELLLAQFGPRTGGILWSLALIAALMGSIRLLWQMHGRQPDRTHLLAYMFPPVLCCVLAGQIGIFLLLAFTVFLCLHESRPFIAGGALSICLMKPHLIALIVVVLLAWSLSRKRFKILAGGGLTFLASALFPLYFDKRIWSDYWTGLRGEHISNEFIPVISTVFRLAIHRDWWILQFVPLLVGLIWALTYFWKRREEWDWVKHGPLLAAVGVLVAPYAWITDESLALPAVLFGLYALPETGRSIVPYALVAFAGLGEVLFTVPPSSGFYLWSAPAWVAWYVYATRPAHLQEPSPAAA
ncbi:MAG TPA: glycosyltransferase family 87 protein [Acidobacteriaceae bacterium]